MNAVEAIYVELFQNRSGRNATRLATARTWEWAKARTGGGDAGHPAAARIVQDSSSPDGRESRADRIIAQLLLLVPGLPGQYLRRAYLARVLEGGCSTSAAIEFGTLFSQVGAKIDERVYIGPRCYLGHVHLERDVLLAAGVHVPSGPYTHGTELSEPIQDQPGTLRVVRIGAGSWIGSNAVVLADVGRETIVGAGAVVTHLFRTVSRRGRARGS
jgi:acetyltransferase-like isoleucine patch superfamily enzyme